MIDIKDISKAELEEKLRGIGAEPYRASQIFRWLYKSGVKSFDEMTDLPEPLREKLKSRFHITRLTVSDSKRSGDGTIKYLFRLEDGNTIETVLIPEKKRATICLSSQVGCKFSCGFCASARFGFIRNLSASEILDEVIFVKKENAGFVITNLVFMGIGEPLDNYDNVLKAIKTLNDKDAFNMGARRITLSSCGIIPAIERLKGEGLQIELSISLHSANDAVRSRLVPVNKIYPLDKLIAACRDYISRTKRIITFEYVLIKDVNGSGRDADALARLLKGINCKVNVIAYNKTMTGDYEAPDEKDIRIFIGALRRSGINVTRRKSRGGDIDAACGQLRISGLRHYG